MTSGSEKKPLLQRIWTVRVFVTNQEEAITFFRDVLELPVQLYVPRFEWVELGPPDERTKLGLVEPDADADPAIYEWQQSQIGRSTGITFETEDIETFYVTMKERGVRFSLPPEQMPWGGIMAVFEDPDGNRYGIVEDPEHYTRDYT
jgi:uncharacterized glyoxalase superfamily protein PhnB